MTDFKFNLGDKAKDRVSGLDGVIMSRAEHLFGCNRYWLSPQAHKDGVPLAGCWMDEDSLELVEVEVVKRQEYRRVEILPGERVVRSSGGPVDQPRSDARGSTR